MALLERASWTTAIRDPTVIVAHDAGATVLWLGGEHDAFSMASLSATLAEAMAYDGGPVVIDLSDVDFMGAATAGVIIRASEFLAAHGRSLEIRAPSRCARRMLDIYGVVYVPDTASLSSS